MSGNVWEWCSSSYQSGSVDVRGTDVRMLRGGSWCDDFAAVLRADFRYRLAPASGNYGRGFRLARS
jgi:formylglycine-generating enzyme required for sulfatase activity